MTVDSSQSVDPEQTADNLTNKEKSRFAGVCGGADGITEQVEGEVPQVMESSMNASQLVPELFEVTYTFKKPVLFRGYIMETSNDGPENDPKDWVINVHNCESNEDADIHEVNREPPRERWTEKLYRIPET